MRKAKEFMLKHVGDVGVDMMDQFINTKLLKDVPSNVLARYQLALPVDRSTSWRWMKKLGCKTEAYTQCFYNDHHQSA